MRTAIGLFAFLIIAITVRSQNTIGLPNIVNYSRQVYNAGSQNWCIAQDSSGIMYFANNKGLLVFDGTSWRTYPLPNGTIVRSLAIGQRHRVYVGGQEEFGYFAPDKNGELRYTSLKPLVPQKDNDFADVWNVCVSDNRIFFRSNKKIFELNGEIITVHPSINWGFLGVTPGGLMAYEYTRGLVRYTKGEWTPCIKTGALPQDVRVTATLPVGKDSILLTTLVHGLYLLKHDTVTYFDAPGARDITNKNIYNACMLDGDRIALITNLVGCVVINRKGEFIQRFTKKEGIQNNNILSVKMDRDMNLWLGLDNGIDLITYSNSIKNIFADGDDRNSGYTSMVHNGQLYLGLSTGLYKVGLHPGNKDLSYTNGSFEFVQHSEGQVWNLSVVNDQLLMGHNTGAYLINNNTATNIDEKTGFWNFQPLYDKVPTPVMIAGTYNGINFYHYNNGAFSNPKIHAQFESARYVAINKDTIWIAHPYKGLYKVAFDAKGEPFALNYTDTKKLLSANHNHLYKAMGKLILTSDNGTFEYDEQQKDFVRAAWLEKLLGTAPISYIKEDKFGNIWFCRDKRLGIVDRSAVEPKVIYISEIDDRVMGSGFEHVNIVDSNNVFVAGERGFFHINYAEYKKSKRTLHALIRMVKSSSTTEGMIFGGYEGDSTAARIPAVKYNDNSLHFESSSNLFGQDYNMEYSYFLEGFDKDWSEWMKRTERDYTNLPEGKYTFKVKCRNTAGNESAIASYTFSVSPPWYRTWWAFLLFIVVVVGVLYIFYKRQQDKYTKLQQIKLQEQQRKYAEEQQQLQVQHELQIRKSETEIVQLKNEKLQVEIEHKNTELASSAMNLVRKMEILSRLKEDLIQYKTNMDSDKGGKEFQKIIRVLDKELDHDSEWEQFVMHFDNVHTNYLKKLKDHCPDLTASELKLAAYLRLNLTTKEIAQLMNISIRGVETSRYRLRKKLELTNETNLFDYLISITK
jgi:DNA-binding CsgD family transcriptional regulator